MLHLRAATPRFQVRLLKLEVPLGGAVRVEPQQSVGRAIGTRRVRAHAKAVRDRLKILLLFVDAMAAAPPPRLVNKRPVRRIHQPDDTVVHATWQLGGEVRDLVFVAEGRHAWCWNGRLACFGETGPRLGRLRNEDPDVVVVLLAGKTARVDAVQFELLIRGEGWNVLALTGMGVEFPAMIATFDLLAVEPSIGKRHASVRAGISQGKRTSAPVPPDHERNFQQHVFYELVAADSLGGNSAV